MACVTRNLRSVSANGMIADRGKQQEMTDDCAIAVFAALGNGARFSIWRHLLAYGADGLPAGVLGRLVGLSASALSFHLRGMTAAGLLLQRRAQRRVVYSIDFETMAALREVLFPDAAPTPEARSPSHDWSYMRLQ